MPRTKKPIKERLLSKVTKNPKTCCWEWTGFTSGGKYGGYAMIKVDGKNVLATRASYKEFVGPIPEGLFILHRCDNPLCINPLHLWAGSQSENMKDMHEKKRHRSSRCGSYMHKGSEKTIAQIARDEQINSCALRHQLVVRGLEASAAVEAVRFNRGES